MDERTTREHAELEIDVLSGVDPKVKAALERMAALVGERTERFTTEEVCERLGVDITEVRARARVRAMARETTTDDRP